MKTINAIINGKLQPWQSETNLLDDYYSPELREMPPVVEAYVPHYKIIWEVVPFSKKIKYYQRLIDIEIDKYVNNIINEASDRSENLIAFKLNKVGKRIRHLLVEVNNLIDRKNYDFDVIASKHADFKIDGNHKECTFIFHYMLTSLMKCWLEVQAQFNDYLHKEDVLTIEDIYSQILLKAAPEKLPIQVIEQIEVEVVGEENLKPQIEESYAIQYAQEKYSVFMDIVSIYKFVEIQKVSVLKKPDHNRLIKLLVENNVSYSIAMLSFLGYLDYLKKTYSITKEKIYQHVAKALQSDVRTVKGNCLVLNPKSNEDRYKYQADQLLEKVEEDYNSFLVGTTLK